MKKHTKLWGLVGLTVILAITGCPTSTSPGTSGTPPGPTALELAQRAATALAKTLNDVEAGTAAVTGDGTIVELLKDIDIEPPDTSASRAVTIRLNSLFVASGVTFQVGRRAVTVTGAATINVDNGGTLTIADSAGSLSVADGGRVRLASNAVLEVAGEIDVENGGEIVLVANATLEVAGTGTIAVASGGSVALASNATLEVAGTLSVAANGSVTVASNATLEVAGTLNVADGAAVTTAGNLEITGSGTLSGGGTITVTGGEISGVPEGKIVVAPGADIAMTYSANTVADLPTAIAKAKALNNGKGTVLLTEDFYTNANSLTVPLVIDANAADNEQPYTIRGQGKGSTHVLTVAVFLANDNVTLEEVKIDVGANINAIPSSWGTSLNYRSALFIARASDATTLLSGAEAASKNVTVQNCDIKATGLTNFTAGIYVWATSSSLPTDISIANNTITAKGSGGSAVQGINIHVWHPTIAITDNTITASYGNPVTSGKHYGAPASALFFNRVYGETLTGSNVAPTISGNTLTSDVYSFYFNACETVTIPSNDHRGVDSLREKNFAVAETTWALDAGTSTYKKLFDALVTDTGTGFGSVSIPYAEGVYDFEHYEIEGGAVQAISVLGDHISNNQYLGTDGVANKFGGGTPNGVDYGRKLASAPSDYNNTNNKFCFGSKSNGSTYDYDTDNIYNN